ncbi:MAG: HAMP domain-containing histidine kinase [Alphaproteobacteria bacterium]|nr:HAMP domain-containing histidine kinase [Alphaproteobacteria bacterium]
MSTLLRLAGFRAALVYTALLLVAMALVLGLLYGRLAENTRMAQDNLIWREAAALSFIHQRDGVRALAQAVDAVGGHDGYRPSYFRLSDGLGNFIAGNLRKFPALDTTNADGWLSFADADVPVRARLLQLDENLVLLVGHNIADGENLLAAFRQAFFLALMAMLLVGLGGGAFLARRGLKQVEAIGAALKPVMGGDLSTRLNMRRDGAEWQALETQINAMLAQLEKLMGATRQVSDNLAHDLRAPLTRLRARLEGLLAETGEAELEAALEDVDGLLKSFNALLALSRLDSGVTTLNAQAVDVAALLAELHDLFAPVFDDNKMTLSMACADALSVAGDAGLLAQALVNLLENTLTHAAIKGSAVTLAAHRVNDTLILSVADGGAGIAADQREQAMARFVQLDESRSHGGSGLGLSLAAAICAHHNGALVLRDNEPGLKAEIHLPIKS